MRYLAMSRRHRAASTVAFLSIACGSGDPETAPAEGDTAPAAAAPAGGGATGSGDSDRPIAFGRNPIVVYLCTPRYRFAARMDRDSAWLVLPTREITLPHVESASGARYSNGAVTFWSRGSSARLEAPPDTFASCAGQTAANVWEAARLRGIDFRAVGNEPGWFVEIDDGERIVAVVDYGERRAVTPAPRPTTADTVPRRVMYTVQTEAHRITVVIEEVACADVMSGEEFPARVTLTVDGKEYRGCGRPLG